MSRGHSWSYLTALVVAALVLSACAGQPAVETAQQPTLSSTTAAPTTVATVQQSTAAPTEVQHEPVTITFWHPAPNPPLGPTFEALVGQFMAQYPWITVDVEGFGFAEYPQKLNTAFAGGTAPDVMAVDFTEIQKNIYFDTIIPLSSFVDSGYLDDWYDIPREDMMFDGEIWAIPLHQSTEAIIYNQALIDEAGLTPPTSYQDAWDFDQFRAALEATTKVDANGVTEVWGFSSQYPPSVYNLQPIMYAFGATYMDPAGETYLGYTNSDTAKQAFSWYIDLFRDGLSPVERTPDMFQTGKVAFLQANPFVLTDIANRYSDLQVGVMPLPCEAKCAVQSGAGHLAITSQSKHPEEAWMLIDFITNYEGEKFWIEGTGYIPARKSVYAALPQFTEYPMSVFTEGLISHAIHRPANIAWPVFSNETAAAVNNAISGTDPGAELDRVAEAAQAELDSYD